MMKILLALLLGLSTSTSLSAQTPFYQGKTVQIRVGFAAGGAFDVWARLMLIILVGSSLGTRRSSCKT
jgi:tripartite-type tricarboxylate transporter receptor subunit TctC